MLTEPEQKHIIVELGEAADRSCTRSSTICFPDSYLRAPSLTIALRLFSSGL